MSAADASPAPPLRLDAAWLLVVVVVALYALLAAHRADLPGIYMDEVNPDYLVPNALHHRTDLPTIRGALPGNFFNDRWPLMTSLYHGTQAFWLGLPLYAVVGTSALAVRGVHAAFAAGLIVAFCFALRATRVPAWAWFGAALGLATDPAFIFAFRTQSYLTLAPSAWLLLSLACLLAPAPWTRSRAPVAGALYGLAVHGYFIYGFFAPALLWIFWGMSPGRPRGVDARIAFRRWIIGMALGYGFAIIGWIRLVWSVRDEGGIVAWLADYTRGLDPMQSQSLAERMATCWTYAARALTNSWNEGMMVSASLGDASTDAKVAALTLLPVVVLGASFLGRRRPAALAAWVALLVSFFLASLIFGRRLGGHHFIVLVPILFAAFAAAAAEIAMLIPRRAATIAFAGGLAAILGVQATHYMRDIDVLQHTRGVGLMSDAIDRFAAAQDAERAPPVVVTPDWGLAMPLVTLTEGRVPTTFAMWPELKRRVFCTAGRDLVYAVVAGDRAARIEEWRLWQDFAPPSRIEAWRQADGAVVFAAARFRAQDNQAFCRRDHE